MHMRLPPMMYISTVQVPYPVLLLSLFSRSQAPRLLTLPYLLYTGFLTFKLTE